MHYKLGTTFNIQMSSTNRHSWGEIRIKTISSRAQTAPHLLAIVHVSLFHSQARKIPAECECKVKVSGREDSLKDACDGKERQSLKQRKQETWKVIATENQITGRFNRQPPVTTQAVQLKLPESALNHSTLNPRIPGRRKFPHASLLASVSVS